MNKLIALTGPAGCGKSTAADFLSAEYGYTIYGFAMPLKRMVGELFDFTSWQLYGPSSARNAPDPRYPRADGTCLSPREALQTFGTDAGRKCYQPIWTEACMRWCDTTDRPVCLADTRFDDEAQAVLARGGLVVRLNREGSLHGAAAAHASEAGISGEYITHNIYNHGSKEELYAQLRALVTGA